MTNPYIIHFEHLSLGQHTFSFEVDKKLFEDAPSMEIMDARFTVALEMLKSANMMNLHFRFNGSFTVPCDRCNDRLTLPLNDTGTLVIKYGQAEHEEFDELLVLAANEYQIDLTQYLYESLSLLLPQRRIHAENDCDPAFLELLEKARHPDRKSDAEEVDPRWEKLKQIK